MRISIFCLQTGEETVHADVMVIILPVMEADRVRGFYADDSYCGCVKLLYPRQLCVRVYPCVLGPELFSQLLRSCDVTDFSKQLPYSLGKV